MPHVELHRSVTEFSSTRRTASCLGACAIGEAPTRTSKRHESKAQTAREEGERGSSYVRYGLDPLHGFQPP